MKVLKKHILKEFLGALWITLISFVALFMIVELIEKVDDVIKHDAPAIESVAYFLYKVPFILCQISPIAVLLSVLISLGILNRNGEITAIKAGGIKLLSAFAPLIAAGIVITILVIFVNESITPITNRMTHDYEKKWFGRSEGKSFGRDGLWLKEKNVIYNIKEVDFTTNTLRGVTRFETTTPFNLVSRKEARSLSWDEDRSLWVAPEATLWSFKDNSTEVAGVEKVNDFTISDLSGPEDFSTVKKNYEDMNFSDLKGYIKALEDEGFKTTRYLTDLYGKLTFPIINFIMVLIGIPFALKAGRHGGVATGIAIAIPLSFSYWILFGITKSMGHNELLPPLMAASLPDLIFITAGILLYDRVKE